MNAFSLKSGETLFIRPAIGKDAEGVISYINTISGESDNLTFGEGEFGITVEDEIKFLESNGKNKNSILIIGILNDAIVSVADIHGGKRPRILHYVELGISVKKKYWNLGIGRRMLLYILDWGKANGVRKINLRVRSDNANAIHLYKSVGFKQEGLISRVFRINSQFISCFEMGLEIN